MIIIKQVLLIGYTNQHNDSIVIIPTLKWKNDKYYYEVLTLLNTKIEYNITTINNIIKITNDVNVFYTFNLYMDQHTIYHSMEEN
jgi:hypothetical protein